jgi:REP element-mobilizing transposase RayT
MRPYQPVHVTMRVSEHVWNLRSEGSFRVVHAAVEGVRRRPDFRLVHFTVLGNHLHLIVEAGGKCSLANGMRAFSIRVARGLNKMMGRSGRVFEDRYHSHVLGSPAEVRNAVRYVKGNFASHAARRGEPMPPDWVDPYSSAAIKGPRVGQLELWGESPTRGAETWLLRTEGNPGRRGTSVREPEAAYGPVRMAA